MGGTKAVRIGLPRGRRLGRGRRLAGWRRLTRWRRLTGWRRLTRRRLVLADDDIRAGKEVDLDAPVPAPALDRRVRLGRLRLAQADDRDAGAAGPAQQALDRRGAAARQAAVVRRGARVVGVPGHDDADPPGRRAADQVADLGQGGAVLGLGHGRVDGEVVEHDPEGMEARAHTAGRGLRLADLLGPRQRRRRLGRRLPGLRRRRLVRLLLAPDAARGRGLALLRDVRQLVRQQVKPGARLGRIAAGREGDIAAERVGVGVDRLRGGVRAGVVVDAHAREVAAEARLEVGPQRRRQRPSPARQCGGGLGRAACRPGFRVRVDAAVGRLPA
jgi:hypothetical protein